MALWRWLEAGAPSDDARPVADASEEGRSRGAGDRVSEAARGLTGTRAAAKRGSASTRAGRIKPDLLGALP
jgi:hypothetical protein